jgi:methylated-DNA-protein-cysteine methyltransferase related protein
MTPSRFEADMHRVISRVPAGMVVTYGEVALEAGHAGAARAVGTILARGDSGLPWWRVVTSTGRLVPGHEREQSRRLRSEGVPVKGDRVVMRGRSNPAPGPGRVSRGSSKPG